MSEESRIEQKRPCGTGCIYQQKGSANWWIQYYRNGKVYRQSAGTSKRRKAEQLLQRKLAEIANHSFIDPKSERTLVKELAEDLLRDYRINGRKSLADVEARWRLHLSKEFGELRASNVGHDQMTRYVAERQTEGASNATINRELAALKRMFTLGVRARKVYSMPNFPHLEERNVRKGFVEDSQYQAIAKACSAEGLWLRAMFEVGYNFGLRVSELLGMRVRQVDLASRTIRLEVGETKNDEGREIEMTPLVYALVQQCVTGKQGEDSVFTRENGKPVRDFRGIWAKVCCGARVGKMVCPSCEHEVTKDAKDKAKCGHCSKEWKQKELAYSGLIFHDLRRTAVLNMVRGGIPERVAMTISGHKTRSVFDRYNIVSKSDLHEAAKKLALRDQEREAAQANQHDYSYSSDIVEPAHASVASTTKLN
jgi:integrase